MTATLLKLRPLSNRGYLHAVADVEVCLDAALTITLHGCRVIRQPGQQAYVALPQVESADGRYYAAVSAHGLREAVQDVVLAAWHQSRPDTTTP